MIIKNYENPKISIIVPIYRVEKYIHKCINSILSQTFKNFECILVDDCSPDICPNICDDFADIDDRIKVIHNKINFGSSISRKIGLNIAIGDFILFIDSDDWIENDMIEKMYSKAIENDYDIIICNYFININNSQVKEESAVIYDKVKIYKQIIKNRNFSASLWNKLIKREIYLNVYFPYNNYIEDRVITIQSIYYSEKIGYINSAFYHYNKNEGSICGTSNNIKKLEDEYYNMIIIIIFLVNNNLIKYLEEEIIERINTIKVLLLKNKKLRYLFKNSLSELYPESIKKINMNHFILYLGIMNNSFIYSLIDLYVLIESKIKIAYRLIIPCKLRYSLWELRNNK